MVSGKSFKPENQYGRDGATTVNESLRIFRCLRFSDVSISVKLDQVIKLDHTANIDTIQDFYSIYFLDKSAVSKQFH